MSDETEPTTDRHRLRTMTDDEVRAAILEDPDIHPTDEEFWKKGRASYGLGVTETSEIP